MKKQKNATDHRLMRSINKTMPWINWSINAIDWKSSNFYEYRPISSHALNKRILVTDSFELGQISGNSSGHLNRVSSSMHNPFLGIWVGCSTLLCDCSWTPFICQCCDLIAQHYTIFTERFWSRRAAPSFASSPSSPQPAASSQPARQQINEINGKPTSRQHWRIDESIKRW